MSTIASLTISQAQEQAQLLDTVTALQTELNQLQSELARTKARVHADNRHIFTLTFLKGEVALLEVRGAADQEQAHTIACNAIKTCQYTVTNGDTINGDAHFFYFWCSVEA